MNIRKLNRLDTLIEKQREAGALQGAKIIVEHKGKSNADNQGKGSESPQVTGEDQNKDGYFYKTLALRVK